MNTFFDPYKDHYNTPPKTRRHIGDRLVLGTRLYFHLKILHAIHKLNKTIKQNRFSLDEWSKVSYCTMKTIEGCGGNIHISGMNYISKSDPVVFVSNHMSTLETFLLPGIVCPKKPLVYVAKQSLIDHRFCGLIMRTIDTIPTSRSNPRQDLKTVMTKGSELLSSGNSIYCSLQANRTNDFLPETINSMGVKLAKRAGVSVIPIAVKTNFWGNGKYLKDLGPIHRNQDVFIEFGKPLTITGNGKNEQESVCDFIKGRLNEWNNSNL